MTVKSHARFKPMYGTQRDNWVLYNVTSRLSIWDVRRLFFTSDILKLVSFRLNKGLRSVNTQSIVHIRKFISFWTLTPGGVACIGVLFCVIIFLWKWPDVVPRPVKGKGHI